MIKVITITALTLTLAAAVFAGFGSIVSSFQLPTGVRMADGLAWDGEYLWVCHVTGTSFYRVTTAGSLVSSFLIHGGSGYFNFEGATFDGKYLWCSDHYYSPIYRATLIKFTTAGSRVGSIGAMVDSFSSAGLTYENGYLWCERFKYTTTGSFVTSFPAPFSLFDLAWDGHYLWSGNKQLTTTGSFVASFSLPSGAGGTTFDGEYLWVVRYTWVYKVDIGVTDLNPGSFGKIKGLYR